MGRFFEMQPSEVLARLRAQPGVRLDQLPASSGLYALRDHTGAICYFGIADKKGFRDRISNKHTTGSEDRSHKFSCAYNVGRMWRNRHLDHGTDAKIAKDLRTAFIRKYCSASFVPIEHYEGKASLEAIERDIIALADVSETVWNRGFKPNEGPRHLVDQLVADRQYSTTDLAALRRQQVRSQEIK